MIQQHPLHLGPHHKSNVHIVSVQVHVAEYLDVNMQFTFERMLVSVNLSSLVMDMMTSGLS